jgi:hypothetical protein
MRAPPLPPIDLPCGVWQDASLERLLRVAPGLEGTPDGPDLERDAEPGCVLRVLRSRGRFTDWQPSGFSDSPESIERLPLTASG